MNAREQHASHGIPNEIVAAFLIDGLHRAERLAQAQRNATITLPRAAYHEIPAHIAAAELAKGRNNG